MSRIDLRFAMIPRRFHDRLKRHEISLAGCGLMAFIVGEANHRTREYVATLAAIKDSAHFPHGVEQLRRELKRLEAAGELHIEVKPGQRGPWVLTVLHDDYFHSRDGREVEVTSTTPDAECAASSMPMPLRGPPPPPPGSSTRGQTRPEIDLEKDQTREAGARAHASGLDDEEIDLESRGREIELSMENRSIVDVMLDRFAQRPDEVKPNTRRVLEKLLEDGLKPHQMDWAWEETLAADPSANNRVKYFVATCQNILRGKRRRAA